MRFGLLDYYAIQRQIFGICPKCRDFFRLSDCKIYLKKKPPSTWLDKIDSQNDRLDLEEEELREMEKEIRKGANRKGQELAKLAIKKVDPVFAPLKLDPNDAKVIFDPVEYIVFNGMSNRRIKDIVLLDRLNRSSEQARIQKSIQDAVETKRYQWETLRITGEGNVESEK